MKEYLHFKTSAIYSNKLKTLQLRFRKAARIMKLTGFFLVIVSLHISAASLAQKVSLSKKNADLKSVLKDIRKQTGFYFIYNNEVIKQSKPVNIEVSNQELEDVLKTVFKPQPLTYTIQNKIIIVELKDTIPKSAPAKQFNQLQKVEVHGIVTDEKGNPLPGATVRILNTPVGTVTDEKGAYKTYAPIHSTLLFQFVGMRSVSTIISGQGGQPINLNITMIADEGQLDQVEVVAYGTTTKRLTTGSLSEISARDIEKQPVSNPILALEGRASGVFVSETGGVEGSNFNIIIQGQNTIAAGKLPLYIIDGVPFGGVPVEYSGNNKITAAAILGSTRTGESPLSNISPDDIESITILKDADATAIYGSRAANGVVVITTKKGKTGSTNVDVDLYSGFSNVTRTIPMLDADQYLTIRKQAFANDNITPTTVNALDLTSFNTGGNTNFQKFLIGNQGYFSNANVDISGGSEQTQFFASANYRHESPVIPGSFADDKTQVSFNVQHHTLDNKFSLNMAVNYTNDNNSLAPVNLSQVYNLAPNLPIYNSIGGLAFYNGYTNPAAGLKNIYTQQTSNLLSNATLNYNILPGLSFKTDLGFNRINTEVVNATLRASKNPALPSSATGTSTLINNYNQLFSVEPQINYTHKIGQGILSTLLGGTYQYTQFVQPLFELGSFTNDALYNDLASLNTFITGSGFSENKYASIFGRVNYDWEGKYILNGTFRRDGSSRFSPGNRFGDFGSVGAAWIFSEENFMKDDPKWFSFGKIRGSYGTIGNDQIADYGYISSYAASGINYSGISSLVPARLANTNNYSWETTKKLNAGVDLGFINDRILLTVDWYRNRTSNLLLSTLPIAAQSGFSTYTGNLPGALVQNEGWEFELNTTNIKKAKFKWTTSINITTPQNKLLAFPGLLNSPFATGYPGTGYVIGQSLNLLSGYQFTGVVNGIATVKDLNGDGTITPGLNANGKGDFAVLGNADPKIYGGIDNSFTYGHIQLDFLIQFVKQKAYNYYNYLSGFPGSNTNLPQDILNYNFHYSSLASAPSSLAYVNYFEHSDQAVSDASYARLKNISLAYNFSPSITNKIGIKNGSVYLRAQNLITITNYKGFDPETQGTAIPPLRLLTIGLQAKF